MIQIPYKLDLILNTKYNYNFDSKKKYKNTDDSKKIKNINKPIESIESLFVNKLKLIILNMSKNDIYWLETDKKTGFNLRIDITNNNRINEKNYSEYVLSNGIVGPIKINKSSELFKYINLDTDELILKPLDFHIDNDDDFINKWKNDNNFYESNIPKIYFYGKITNNSGDLLSHYYITKKYNNYKDILKKDYNFAITYLKKILELLDNLLSREYIFRNLYLFGLGFEIKPINNSFEIIILDYTNNSLLPLRDNFFKQFNILKCYNKKCAGNLTPYYIIDDYYNLKSNWLERLNKSYSLGLVEIILTLFYTNDINLSNIYDFIIGPSIFESQLHYYHFYKRFNSDSNIHNLNLSIYDLNMRFCNINPLMETELKIILINLLDKNYEKINYPNQILNLIKKIEESNNEFKIDYELKENIYNYDNNNYLKIDIDTKNKILLEDKYLYLYKKYKTKYQSLKNNY